jgi:hypothetical protein
VDPYVGSPDIDTIKSSFISTSDYHILDLTIGAGIKSEVIGRSFRLISRHSIIFGYLTINQCDIVNREICNALDT